MATSKDVIRSDSLPTDRVNGKYDDDFVVCPICTNILWKPVACKTCENCFCLSCIRLWLNEKPNQCPFNCRFQERKPPGILLKLLSKLNLDCENKSQGCELIIPYEALEKHQQRECDYRLMTCLDCLQEMFSKDYQQHRDEVCTSKQLTCLKCSTVYLQNEGHIERQCIQKQIAILEAATQRPGVSLRLLQENFNKLTQLYTKLVSGEDYAERIELKNTEAETAPSAPPEEFVPTPSAPVEEPSTPSTPVRLRLSSVDFSLIRGRKREGDHVPNGYAGFNWENAYYISNTYVKDGYPLKGFLPAFSESVDCVVFNGNGNPLSIYLRNASNKFGVHSFSALSVYHDEIKISVTGFRSNVPILTKQLVLSRGPPKLFQIDFEQIDKITFTPTGIDAATLKKLTLCIVFLNFML